MADSSVFDFELHEAQSDLNFDDDDNDDVILDDVSYLQMKKILLALSLCFSVFTSQF